MASFAVLLLPGTDEVDRKAPTNLYPEDSSLIWGQDGGMFSLCVGWKSTEPALVSQEEQTAQIWTEMALRLT